MSHITQHILYTNNKDNIGGALYHLIKKYPQQVNQLQQTFMIQTPRLSQTLINQTVDDTKR